MRIKEENVVFPVILHKVVSKYFITEQLLKVYRGIDEKVSWERTGLLRLVSVTHTHVPTHSCTLSVCLPLAHTLKYKSGTAGPRERAWV